MEEKHPKKSVRDEFAKKFISILESDQPLKWTKEWSTGNYSLPYNGQTGRKYNGINRFILMFQALEKGYTDIDTGFQTHKFQLDPDWIITQLNREDSGYPPLIDRCQKCALFRAVSPVLPFFHASAHASSHVLCSCGNDRFCCVLWILATKEEQPVLTTGEYHHRHPELYS